MYELIPKQVVKKNKIKYKTLGFWSEIELSGSLVQPSKSKTVSPSSANITPEKIKLYKKKDKK